MNILILIVIYVIIVLLISLLFGWILSKWKFKNYLKKLDKQIKLKSESKDFMFLKMEQEKADELRLKDQIKRRKDLIKKGIDFDQFEEENINEPEESNDKWEEF